MKINIKKLPILLCSFIVISCNTGQEKNIKTDDNKELEAKANECIYSFSDSTIKLFWAGYKTTDKLKVLGSFQEIKTNHSDQKFSSIDELVNGITFSINSKSSESGDPIRDANLRDYFFNYLTDNFQINGRVSEYNDAFTTANFDRRLYYGKDILTRYYQNYSNQILNEENVKHAEISTPIEHCHPDDHILEQNVTHATSS